MPRGESTQSDAFDKLEAVTRSLEKEREFFDALMKVRPVAVVANRIIHLVTFFQGAAPAITLYLDHHGARLFPTAPLKVASTLTALLNDIVRSARLTAYLCVKGIPDQALAVLRGAVEQVGVYTHVWHDPGKYCLVPDPESDDFTYAFRCARDKALVASLKARGVRYRFMRCKAAKPLSSLYGLLSAQFVHGRAGGVTPAPNLCCEFVERAEPRTLSAQYEMVQAVLSLIYMELIGCIPSDDLLTDELAHLTIASAILGPTVSSAPGEEDPELKSSVDKLLSVLGSLTRDEPIH